MNHFFRKIKTSSKRSRYIKSKGYKPRSFSRGSGKGLSLLKDPRLAILGGILVIVVLIAVYGPVMSSIWKGKKPGKTAPVVQQTPEKTPDEAKPVIRDLSSGSQSIDIKSTRINQPSISGKEMVYAAGSGSIDEPVLKNLFLYDLDSGKEEKIAEAKVSFGEIYETLFNDRWVVWLDTDQKGTNVIMAYNRGSKQEMKIKECKNNKPKLRLWEDTVIWMEQTEDQEDKLYMFDLISGENMPLAVFHDAASYGVSAPCIYAGQIVWAGPDADQSKEERESKEKSIINIIDIKNLGSDISPESYKPDSYVHEPITNGKVLAWLDGNKSPDSRLLLTVDRKVVKEVAQGVSSYGLGDDFIVYGKENAIWVYYWDKDEYGCLTSPGEKAMLPSAQGKTVVWYDKSDEKSSADHLRFKRLD